MKTVNIFGCCCSRNMFNYYPLVDTFQVQRYAFQVCIWACFEQALGVPEHLLKKIQEAAFTLRMLDYDMNKVTLQEFEKVPADYFMIDLMNMSFPLYRVTYEGKETYMQNAFAAQFFSKVKNAEGFESFTFEEVPLSSVPEEKVLNGLDRLAEWVLRHYRQEQIILFHPLRAKKYVGNSGMVREYPDTLLSAVQKERHLLLPATEEFEGIVLKYTNYLRTKLGNCNFVASVDPLAFDKLLSDNPPPSMHYAPSTYVEQGERLLEVLNMSSESAQMKWDKLLFSYNDKIAQEKKKYEEIQKTVSEGFNLNLNRYFRVFLSALDRNDYILFLSCREDMSVKYSDFTQRKNLGMTVVPKFKDSYIAVIDFETGQVQELTAGSLLHLRYVNPAHFENPVDIISGGTNCMEDGSSVIASVKINGTEQCFNSRGCNIVVYQKSTRKVVDSFVCDLNRDQTLGITSKFETNYVHRMLAEL